MDLWFMRKPWAWPIAAFIVSFFMVTAAMASEFAVDLELVLAVDASGSVDDSEFRLQLEGIATAIEDPAVIAAIGSGPLKRIAVELLVWADHPVPADKSGWYLIEDAASAAAFAQIAAAYPRRVNGGTGMGKGVADAARSLENNGYRAQRLTIDVSGDGRESPPRDYAVLMPQARTMAQALGIGINGLAILGSEDGLEQWYRDNVLSGPGAFLEVAKGYEDFARAMRRKLIQEIDMRPKLSWSAWPQSSSPASLLP